MKYYKHQKLVCEGTHHCVKNIIRLHFYNIISTSLFAQQHCTKTFAKAEYLL